MSEVKMKAGLAFAMLMLATCVLLGTGSGVALGQTNSANTVKAGDSGKDTQLSLQVEEVLHPFWFGRAVHNEPVLFVQDEKGGAPRASLLFIPTHIVHASNNAGDEEFELGKDFEWDAATRELRLTQHSRIQFMTFADLHPPKGSPTSFSEATGGATGIFIDRKGSTLQGMQVTITYEHSDSWIGYVPPTNDVHLMRTISKLRSGQPVSIVILGDSISAGAAASGSSDFSPYQPPYAGLLQPALAKLSKSTITVKNLSVGGKRSEWGETMADAVVAAKPDLVILGFGANDATAGVSAGIYAMHLRNIMAKVDQSLPRTDFLLIATMAANPEWSLNNPGLCREYREQLRLMVADGVALSDMTSLWKDIIARKNFMDLSSNGVNHPNDFGYRIYASSIVQMLQTAKQEKQ